MSALEREPRSERIVSAIIHKRRDTARRHFTVLGYYLPFIYMGEKGLPMVQGIKKKQKKHLNLLHLFKNVNSPKK